MNLQETATISRAFIQDYPGESVPKETFTHSHLSWSSIILYQLPPSTTIHSILHVQVSWLGVFLHNLSPSPLWSTRWSGTLHFIHFFIQSLSSFCNTCPYHHNLFCCSTEIMSSNPNLSHNSLLGTLSFTLTSHIHQTILISAIKSLNIPPHPKHVATLPCKILMWKLATIW